MRNSLPYCMVFCYQKEKKKKKSHRNKQTASPQCCNQTNLPPYRAQSNTAIFQSKASAPKAKPPLPAPPATHTHTHTQRERERDSVSVPLPRTHAVQTPHHRSKAEWLSQNHPLSLPLEKKKIEKTRNHFYFFFVLTFFFFQIPTLSPSLSS
jgi:hypothetical protein